MSTDSEKSSASAIVSDSSKDLSTTSEEVPSSDDMPQPLPYIHESSPVESPQEESIDDSLMFSEFPSKGIVTAVFSESSDEEDPPVPASQENMLVEPSQLNRSPWNFVCNFRPAAVYLKSAMEDLSNPDGSGNIDVPARVRCTKAALYEKKFSFLALSQKLTDVGEESTVYLGNHTGTDKLDIRVLAVGALSDSELNDQVSGRMAVEFPNSIQSALGHLHLNPARFLCTKLLNGKRFSFLVFPQKSADTEDGTTVYLASPEGSDTVDIRHFFKNPFLFFGFRGSKPLTVRRFSILALPQRLADIEDEATLYLANQKGGKEVDMSFILELKRATHVPPPGATVPAFVGQGSQPPANQMLGGPGLGLGPAYLAQGGPMAIPAVVAQAQLGRLVHIIDFLVDTSEHADDNDTRTIQTFRIPENRATSWGWLAEEVYDAYLLGNPDHQFDHGTRLNPYICWPHRSVSYTSLSGQTFVWPNTPWEIVKQRLIHINLRGGWA